MRQSLLPLRPRPTPSRLGPHPQRGTGRHKLYSVPADQRALVRRWAGAWRRYQRARARFGKQTAALLALADQLAQTQTVRWPKPKTNPPPP